MKMLLFNGRFLELVPIGYVFESRYATMGAVAGVATSLTGMERWLAPGYFLVALLVAMTLELLSCYLSKTRSARHDHNWERSFIGKLFIVFLVVCAFLLDGALYFGVNSIPFSETTRRGVIANGMLPVTLSSLSWCMIAEIARTVRNVVQHEGKDSSIPPAILWFIRQVRREDVRRFPGQDGPPPRRWVDDLTEEQIAEILVRHAPPSPTPSSGEPTDDAKEQTAADA